MISIFFGMDPRALGETLHFETPWVWYAHFHSASTNYGKSYVEIGRFATIAQFWRLFNSTPSIAAIHKGSVAMNDAQVIAYSLFRQGVRPEWEDPVNQPGSEWGCRESLDEAQFCTFWKEYVLGAIGEQIPHCVGLRAINKSNRSRTLHKIEVWMDTVEHALVQECRRSLTAISPATPKFQHLIHEQKQIQALEYQRRRRKSSATVALAD